MKPAKKIGILIVIFFISFLINSAYASNASGWIKEVTNIERSKYFGVTVANGMIGLVSSSRPLQMEEIILNGVFDYYGRGRVSNILKGFNFAGMELTVNDVLITSDNISNLKQSIDMKKAVFTTTFDFDEKVSVKYSVRALRHLPYTSLIDLEIVAKADIKTQITNEIRSPDILRNVKNIYTEIERPHVLLSLLTSVGQSPTLKHTLAASNSFLFSGHETPKITHEEWDHNMHLIRFHKSIKRGDKFQFSVVATETSTEHYNDPHNEAERLTIFATLEGRDKLVERHEREWEKLWESDIIIGGNLKDQIDVRFALYHLYSFAREGTAYSLSPMGLSGLGYNGHVFWDTEIWMYPALVMLQPKIARSLLDYRYERLEQAKRKALSHGYDGAMFPWESDDTGQESTPIWSLTGPFEHHVTGTIAFAYWNYYCITKDQVWLKEKGFPMLKEIAKFWISRVEKGKDGLYHILNVVGADEWAENVDDNAFTNGVAIVSLKIATKAASILGETIDPMWKTISQNIPILKFPDGVTKEHATYVGESIKQVDVNLLAYPLKIITSEKDIEKDLVYYEPRIGYGPAMSHSVLSVLYSRLRNDKKAYSLFQKGYIPNEVPPFGVLAENAGGTNPYFATGAGGMLQAVMAGFGGLDITDEGLIRLKTKLPDSWTSLNITGIKLAHEQ